MQIREIARAKINLTLRVLGRRPDGYHDIESLVTFAGVGDRVTLDPGRDLALEVGGPFAGDIEGPNLIERALALLRETGGGLMLGAVALEKNLPVAAGLGGGSADAAALLRAVRRANPELAGVVPWDEIALSLGADVPVCLAGQPAIMRGIGERMELLGRTAPQPLPVVLANPGLPLSTARVFAALSAGPLSPRLRGEGRHKARLRPVSAPHPSPLPTEERGEGAGAFADLPPLVAYVRTIGNDLELPAIALLPVITEVKAALAEQAGCLISAMSGSGPTCFGLFQDAASAARAAADLTSRQPGWWVAATSCDWPG